MNNSGKFNTKRTKLVNVKAGQKFAFRTYLPLMEVESNNLFMVTTSNGCHYDANELVYVYK